MRRGNKKRARPVECPIEKSGQRCSGTSLVLGGIHLAGSLITVDGGALLFRGGRVVRSNFEMGALVQSWDRWCLSVSMLSMAIRCIHQFECWTSYLSPRAPWHVWCTARSADTDAPMVQ